jgi:GntR family carbon starvation induced transcriptional regulator
MLSLIESAEPEPAAPRSQTSAAYARLRRDILSGRFQPDEKLKITDLATALEVSPGAIREALSRLVPEQLVISRDQKGFVVAPLSVEDLEDLTDLRCEIEAVALRRAVKRGGVGWESSILAAAHRLRRTEPLYAADRTRNPEWAEHHQAFHAALVSACGSRRLLELHSQLYQQSERYRDLSLQIEGERNVVEEHQEIVDAALDRDADRLVDLTIQHLRETTSRIVNAARGESADGSKPVAETRRKRADRARAFLRPTGEPGASVA